MWDMLGKFRCLKRSFVWDNEKYLKWWLDLVFRANFKDDVNTVSVGNVQVELRRGELTTSQMKLAKDWNASAMAVRIFISKLLKHKMISIKKVG
mgnify:CR=1 FL=1